MTIEQIATLAKEYSEETTKTMTSDPNLSDSDINGIKHDVAEWIEELLHFLLRRYYLVEKEEVRKEYEPVKDTSEECNYEELGATWDEAPYLITFYDVGYKCGQKETIESLFPDLGKEVEE